MVSHKVSITLVLFFCINLISTNIFASNVGGWSMGNPIAQGASTIYEGSKNVIINGADYVKKGTATITPTAANVAKTLGKGVAGVAVSVAVEQLLGAVDWVLDPANNQIKYNDPSKPVDPRDPTVKYYYYIKDSSGKKFEGASPKDACKPYIESSGMVYDGVQVTGGTPTSCKGHRLPSTTVYSFGNLSKVTNPAYDPAAEPSEDDKKTIPLDTVAQQVITNAESATDPKKKAAAQAVTLGAAADIVAEAETDSVKARPIAQQLEATSTTKPADAAAAAEANTATGTQTQNPTKPETTDLALEFPAFCGWAPLVCEAAQVVISFPQTLTNWWETGKLKAEEWANSISEAWTSAKEWVKEEPSKDDQVEIEEKQPEQKTVDLNFGSACPAPVVLIDSTFYDQPFKIEYSFNDFCSILSDFVRPVLIAIGAFISALILGGVKTNE
jgi:hypothetical protein